MLPGAPTIQFSRNGFDRRNLSVSDLSWETRFALIKGVQANKYRIGKTLRFSSGLKRSGSTKFVPAKGPERQIPVFTACELAELPRSRAAFGFGIRTWTDQSGSFKHEAAFGEYEKGVVTLYDRKGKAKSVELKLLSKSDQAWVRDRLRYLNER
ncbi:MAG: SHD1 domain-containing protein [Planctomycetota bacterium]